MVALWFLVYLIPNRVATLLYGDALGGLPTLATVLSCLVLSWPMLSHWGTMGQSAIHRALTLGKDTRTDLMLLLIPFLIAMALTTGLTWMGTWFVSRPPGAPLVEVSMLLLTCVAVCLVTALFHFETLVMVVAWGDRFTPADASPAGAPHATDLFSDLDLESRSHG